MPVAALFRVACGLGHVADSALKAHSSQEDQETFWKKLLESIMNWPPGKVLTWIVPILTALVLITTLGDKEIVKVSVHGDLRVCGDVTGPRLCCRVPGALTPKYLPLLLQITVTLVSRPSVVVMPQCVHTLDHQHGDSSKRGQLQLCRLQRFIDENSGIGSSVSAGGKSCHQLVPGGSFPVPGNTVTRARSSTLVMPWWEYASPLRAHSSWSNQVDSSKPFKRKNAVESQIKGGRHGLPASDLARNGVLRTAVFTGEVTATAA